MPFDAVDQKLANLETLCSLLEESSTFDMRTYRYHTEKDPWPSCGSPGCIVGHSWVLWPNLRRFVTDPRDSERDPIIISADTTVIADRIGVDRDKFRLLTHLWWSCGGLCSTKITGKMAAAALRRLYHTGEARYDLADA